MKLTHLFPVSTKTVSGSFGVGFRVLRARFLAVWAILVLVWSLGGAQHVEAQRLASRSVEELAADLRASVLRSDVSDLMLRSAESVEIELFGERRHYSRGQAMLILNGLLEDARPNSVRITRSQRTPSAAFIEATVTSSKPGSESVWLARYALLRGEWRMRELRVDEANE